MCTLNSILIKNGRVWDGERFMSADVLTSGKTVRAIADHIDEAADFTYDASGRTVSVGLVDAHVHMRGISCERFGIQAEMSCFPFGVTSAADASAELGDRALIDSFMIKSAVFVCSRFKNNKADLSEAKRMLELYGDKAVGVKVYFDTTVSEVFDASPLYEVCEFARDNNLKVMVHCSNSPIKMAEILNVLSRGDILTHSFHGGDNNASVDGFDCIRSAQERGIVIDAGMAGHVHTDFGIFANAVKCGIRPDVISTDVTVYSAYTRGGRYGMTMCMNIARASGMSEEEIFRAVTSAPSHALGMDGAWGRLRVGRAADIAVFDWTNEGFDLTDYAGNRIQADNGYRCVLTVSDGQVVFKD